MTLGLVGQIIINKKNKYKHKNSFQKNPWRSVCETHRQRARQDQIPAYFTQLSHSGKFCPFVFNFGVGSICSPSVIYWESPSRKFHNPPRVNFYWKLKLLIKNPNLLYRRNTVTEIWGGGGFSLGQKWFLPVLIYLSQFLGHALGRM